MNSAKKKKNERRKTTPLSKGDYWLRFSGRAVRWVFYGSLLLGASVFFPDYFSDGFKVPKLFFVPVWVARIVCLLFVSAALRKDLSVRFPQIFLPLLVVFIVAAASVGWSLNKGLAIERLFQVSALAAYLFIAWSLYRGRDIHRAFYFIILVAALIALWALLLDYVEPLRKAVYPNFITRKPGKEVDLYRPLTSNQGNPNYLLHILVPTAPAALGSFLRELALSAGKAFSRRKLLALLILAGAFVVQLVCFILSRNRSGLVAFVLALLFFSLVLVVFKRKQLVELVSRSFPRILLPIAGLVLLSAGVILFTEAGRSLAGRIKEAATYRLAMWQDRFKNLTNPENIDVYSRVVFLEAGTRMISDDPLWGKGIGQFVIYYPGYKTEKHWKKFSLLPPQIKMWDKIPPQTHNEFLQIAVELGLLALAAFL
ncbi:MAG: hypothetical protein DRG59_09380, partial [Deltaproteobacteria bacterium]